MPAIEPHHKQNFEMLLRAAKNGDLALVDARDKETGETVRLIAAIQSPTEPGGDYLIIPIAKMIEEDPFERFDGPGHDQEG